jgi:hypothetical protein
MILSFRKHTIGNLIFEIRDKCQEKKALCGRNEWRKFSNYLLVTQSDFNLWYIEKLPTITSNEIITDTKWISQEFWPSDSCTLLEVSKVLEAQESCVT